MWHSKRLFSLVLLMIAIVLGAQLRFHHLTRAEMNGDEGASWAAASAPNIQQVAGIEARLDPGKLALYDVLLHEWIEFFGDSLFTMRSMSGILGTIAIVLVLVCVREVCRSLGGESTAAIGDLAGSFAALLYATNLQMVLSDRTVRMYPLTMCAELSQITFFVRAQRRGGTLNFIGIAVFTAMMVACNFTSAFLLAMEAFWVGWLLLESLWHPQDWRLAIFGPGCAVLAGIMILIPWLPDAFASSHNAVEMGAIDWITPQPVSWLYTALRDSTGAGAQSLFWILVALAAFGAWRHWGQARRVVEFFAFWAVGPILVVMAVTYMIHPLEFARYVLIAFVGLFALAALGASSASSTALRVALALLMVYLSVRPVHRWIRHSGQTAWRDATLLASQKADPGEKIAVFPGWCINVVRFYMPPDRRSRAEPLYRGCGPARVLILGGRGVVPNEKIASAEACYPRVLARLQLVEVRAR